MMITQAHATQFNVNDAAVVLAHAKAIESALWFDENQLMDSINARENKQDEIETAWDMHNGDWRDDMTMDCGCCSCCGCDCDYQAMRDAEEEPAYMWMKEAAWQQAIVDGILIHSEGITSWDNSLPGQ